MNSIVTQRFVACHRKLLADQQVRSSRQFALSLDYLPQSLSEILKGRRDVTIELLRKAVEKYGINPTFLCTGEGEMFLQDEAHAANEDLKILTIVADEAQNERIVHVPVAAQAGYGHQLHDPVFMQELPTFSLPDYRFNSGTFRSFDIAGDSMEPTLFMGDKVVCRFVEPDRWQYNIKDNYVYVLVTKGDVLVKRVINKMEAGGELVLYSDNGFYQPYSVPADDIREVWYVCMKISPFMPSPSHVRNALHEEIDDLRQKLSNQTQLIRNLNVTIEKLLKQNRARI